MRSDFIVIIISLFSVVFFSCSEEQVQGPVVRDEIKDEQTKGEEDACYGIVNGTTTTQFPEVGLIARPLPGNQFYFCTATFIAKNALLSAAHCLVAGDFPRYITGSDISLTGFQTVFDNAPIATQVINHGNTYFYGSIDINNEEHRKRDSVVLIFDEDITDKFYPVAETRPGVGQDVSLVGFGQTTLNQTVSSFTKRTGTNILINSGLSSLVAINGPLTTQASATKTMGLPGDSGGPLLHNGEIVGILSAYYTAQEENLYVDSASALTKDLLTRAADSGAKIPGYFTFPEPEPDPEPDPEAGEDDLVASAEDKEDDEDPDSSINRSSGEGIDLCGALR